jgi:acyl-CoA synthetase (AMP-forming)/AMP-acid ligase II
MVRLSALNLEHNARAIASSLGIGTNDRAITSLPVHYSFGMSVITSHVVADSPIVVTNRSVIEPEFWDVIRNHKVSFLAGVPQTYEMLWRLKPDTFLPPSLRSMIQAGGRLGLPLVDYFHDLMTKRGGRFHVMYGQTEAAPRMACLPSERLPEKRGSVGLALEEGHFEILDSGGGALRTGELGEVVYYGPNVMLGYAESPIDLALGDVMHGELRTGDLGYLDNEGFLYLTGRMKRIAKVAGLRISLDDIEARLGRFGPFAVVSDGDSGIVLFRPMESNSGTPDLKKLASDLRIHHKALRIIEIPALPLLSSGKINYAQLAKIAQERK